MKKSRGSAVALRWLLAPTLAMFGGCGAALERSLDLILAPAAAGGNLEVLPLTPFIPLARLLLRV